MMKIRKMIEADKECVIAMMQVFYASPAVFSNGSDKIFADDFDACIQESPYLEGFVFEEGEVLQGYAMVAKSFSTEFGKPCMWLEDLYIKPEYRGRGIGNQFLTYMKKLYPDTLFRLEVEEENERAVALYTKQGFDVLPYMEMKKLNT